MKFHPSFHTSKIGFRAKRFVLLMFDPLFCLRKGAKIQRLDFVECAKTFSIIPSKLIKMRITLLLLLLFQCSINFAQQNETPINILLIGTVHSFDKVNPMSFDSVMQKLRDFQPNIICIENIPPNDKLSLEAVRTSLMQHADSVRIKKQLVDVDLEDLIKKKQDQLKANPNDLLARSNLANALYVKYDFWNAYYHWHVLYERAIDQDQELSADLIASLLNENWHESIYKRHQSTEFGHLVYPIAKELQFLHLYNIDERSEDAVFQQHSKKLALRLLFNFKIFKLLKYYKAQKKLLEELPSEEVFYHVNSPVFQQELNQLIAEADTKWSRSKKTTELVQIWERRNEEMAKRILERSKVSNAQNILVFFGAAHVNSVKKYLVKESINVLTFNDL